MALDKTNLVTFKRGLEASLVSASIIKDAFYLTTDTHRLYVGVQEADGSTHPALLNSAVKVYGTLTDLINDKQYKPTIGDIAFVEKDDTEGYLNALIMYNGNGWTQINYSDTEIRELIAANTEAAANAQTKADAAMPKAGGEFTGSVKYNNVAITEDNQLVTKAYVDNAVTNLEIGDYATTEYVDNQVTEINGKIAGVDTKAGNAATAAENAQNTADANAATIGILDKDTMGATVIEYIGKVKETADAAAVKTVVDGQIQELNTAIGNVDDKADGIAEELEELAGNVVYAENGVFTNTPKVGDTAIATISDVAAAKSEIIDGATLTTLKAIEDKHASDLETINSKFEAIQGNVDSLANVMTFVGVTTEEITDETTTVTIDGEIYTPDTGDVVIDKNGEEFVWDGTAWKQFGSASATTAMIAALEQAIGDNAEAIASNDGDILALQEADVAINSRIDGVKETADAAATKIEFDKYVEDNNAALKIVADKVNHETTGLAKTYELASNAATQIALNDEITARENAVNEVIEQLTWGSF